MPSLGDDGGGLAAEGGVAAGGGGSGRGLGAAEVGAIAAAAAQAVLQVLLIASAGAYLRLSKASMKTLSDLAYKLLLPCLMFYNVTKTVSAEALRRLWIVPFGAAFMLAAGWAAGALVAPLVGLGLRARARDDFTRVHFLLACSIGNHGYLPRA